MAAGSPTPRPRGTGATGPAGPRASAGMRSPEGPRPGCGAGSSAGALASPSPGKWTQQPCGCFFSGAGMGGEGTPVQRDLGGCGGGRWGAEGPPTSLPVHGPAGTELGSITLSLGCPRGCGVKLRRRKGGKIEKKKKGKKSKQGSELATENVRRGARPSEFPSQLCEPRRRGPRLGCCSLPGKRPPKAPLPPKSPVTQGMSPPPPALLRTPAPRYWGADEPPPSPKEGSKPGRRQSQTPLPLYPLRDHHHT